MLLFGANAIKEICIFLWIDRINNYYAYLLYLQFAMFGTLDYNKVPIMKAFISKNCSRSVQYRCYKDQQKFYQEIYGCLGNLIFMVTSLVKRPPLKDM